MTNEEIMKSLHDTICIDPGRHTGLAQFFSACNGPITQTIASKMKNLTLDKAPKYIDEMCVALKGIVKYKYRYRVIIEVPVLYSASAKSMASYTKNDCTILTLLVGAFIDFFSIYSDSEIQLLTPNQWKGQLDKKATKELIRRKTGWVFPNDHETDAVGMGLSRLPIWPNFKGEK